MCSLLHVPSGVLFVGDALVHVHRPRVDRLRYPFAAGCTTATLARVGAARLAELDFEIAAFAHGPALTLEAREAIRAFCKNDGR